MGRETLNPSPIIYLEVNQHAGICDVAKRRKAEKERDLKEKDERANIFYSGHESPELLEERLTSCGVSSIDIKNTVSSYREELKVKLKAAGSH